MALHVYSDTNVLEGVWNIRDRLRSLQAVVELMLSDVEKLESAEGYEDAADYQMAFQSIVENWHGHDFDCRTGAHLYRSGLLDVDVPIDAVGDELDGLLQDLTTAIEDEEEREREEEEEEEEEGDGESRRPWFEAPSDPAERKAWFAQVLPVWEHHQAQYDAGSRLTTPVKVNELYAGYKREYEDMLARERLGL